METPWYVKYWDTWKPYLKNAGIWIAVAAITVPIIDGIVIFEYINWRG